MSTETWELLSYIVTVFGLPLAIGVFFYEQRKERENEEEERMSARRAAACRLSVGRMREAFAKSARRRAAYGLFPISASLPT
jgi:hypothetical protein